ncbi:MAG: hypothetical protein GX320_06100 [Tissierellia bacterium]|nr:hypothetical protein [Tissierellia bacterium]
MNWFRKFMVGRYGVDQLSTALLIVSIFFSILSRFFNSGVLNILNMIILFIIFYRIFSKDIGRRYQENNKFLKIWYPIKNKVSSRIQRIKSLKDYRYYKCSNCKQKLRVPKGKGRIAITCPKCKMTMIKKS